MKPTSTEKPNMSCAAVSSLRMLATSSAKSRRSRRKPATPSRLSSAMSHHLDGRLGRGLVLVIGQLMHGEGRRWGGGGVLVVDAPELAARHQPGAVVAEGQ